MADATGGIGLARVDERDIMFSRLNYKEGSKEYLDYYSRHPEREEMDRELRRPAVTEGNPSYEPLVTPIGDSVFRFLADIKKYAEGPVMCKPVAVEPDEITEKLKGLARYYGADIVKVVQLSPEFYYSYRGRESSVYGEKIDTFHRYAIVYAVEMDKDMIEEAPFAPEAVEVTKGYLDAAIIGMVLSYYLRGIGYPARNHMDGNYLLPMPRLAEEAGIGEIGKIGVLVTKEFGPRIRLGAVTTDVELIPDSKELFDILSFCNLCNNCALRCPSQAIPLDTANKDEHKRVSDYLCYSVWKRVFTDCGICLASCPFSGKNPDVKNIQPPYSPEKVREIVDAHNIALHKKRMDPKRPFPWLDRKEGWL